MRISGSIRQNHIAPTTHATPPTATVIGAPTLCASAPPNSAPNGASPINDIEYNAITRPRSSFGTMVCISVFEHAICSIIE